MKPHSRQPIEKENTLPGDIAAARILFIPRHPFASDSKTKKTVAPIKDLLKHRVVLGVNIFLIAVLQRACAGIADRRDPRLLIILGTVISGLAVFAMPYAKGFVMILILNIIMGSANGISMPAGFVLTTRG